jgi:hypothetical protein
MIPFLHDFVNGFANWLKIRLQYGFNLLNYISIEYGLAALVLCWFGVFLYIKLRYPFWNIQPVTHTYSRWFASSVPTVVHTFPPRTKYVIAPWLLSDNNKPPNRLSSIESSRYEDLTREQKSAIVRLLRSNYIPSDRVFCSVDDAGLKSMLVGKSIVSIVVLDNSLVDRSLVDRSLIGFTSSRGIQIWILNGSVSNMCPAYYMDWFCLSRHTQNQKQAAYQLFQTHEWNQRIADKDVHVTLFRRDTHLCAGVVPFVQFRSATYPLRNLQIEALPPDFQLKLVRPDHHTHFVYDFLDQFDTNHLFDAAAFVDKASIHELLAARQLFVGALVQKEQLYGLYFLKNANIKYDELEDITGGQIGGDTLHLVASFSNTDLPDLFYTGFLHCMREILKDRCSTLSDTIRATNRKSKNRPVIRRQAINERFGILMMDAIGHSISIVERWETQHVAMVRVESAYYLYNYVWSKLPVDPNRAFILV